MPRHFEVEYDEDDGYRPQRPRNGRMSSNYFAADEARYYDDVRYQEYGGERIHRARSQGHGPRPAINIYNTMEQDNNQQQQPGRGRQPNVENIYVQSPPPAPQMSMPQYVPQYIPTAPPPPQAPIYVNVPRDHHSRSRSRSRHDRGDSAERNLIREMTEMRMRTREYEEHEARDRAINQYIRDQDREKDEIKHAIEKAERKQREREKEEEEAVDKFKRKEQEDKDKKDADFKKWKLEEEHKKKKKEDEEEEIIRKWKQKQDDEKKEREEKEKEWERKRIEKEKKEEDKKKKEEEEYHDRLRKDLGKFGLSNNQIESVIHVESDEESDKRHHHHHSGTVALATRVSTDISRRPVFPKLRLTDIEIETLRYYDLPYELDPEDRRYVIILQELTERETDILFEHTRRIRTRTTLSIEATGKNDKNYAFVRHRSKSRARSPSNRERLAEALIFGGRR